MPWCMGQYSNQRSHLAKAKGITFEVKNLALWQYCISTEGDRIGKIFLIGNKTFGWLFIEVYDQQAYHTLLGLKGRFFPFI